MAWQWREVPESHMDTPWQVDGWKAVGWASLSSQDSCTLQNHMDSHLTSESLVGAKLTLSPLRIVSCEYTLVWAHDCTFFLAQKTDYTGVRTIICKPIKNRIFRPYVISYWPGVIGVRLTSAFSGEEVCSKLLCGNEFTWTHMMESFRHTFIEMGITYPEIRAIKLQNDANEELNLEHPIEHNEERLHKESEESSDSSIDFWTR